MAAEANSEPRTAGSAVFETSTFADGDSGRTARVSLGSGRSDRASLLVEVAAASVLRRLSDVSVQQRSASVVISNVHLKDCGERAELPATAATLLYSRTGCHWSFGPGLPQYHRKGASRPYPRRDSGARPKASKSPVIITPVAPVRSVQDAMPGSDSSSARRPRVPQTAPEPPRYIVIEGPLRVGKTTLSRVLAERLHARRIYDCEENPFLGDFYGAKPGAAFRAQLYFLMERQKRIREGLAGHAPGPVISDFLMEKDRIFANINLDDDELKLYERFYEALTVDVPQPDLVIYLQAKPEVPRTRIAKKRAHEERQIAIEYVEEVARAYEHFFFRYEGADLLVIDTSEIDFVERSEDLQQLLRRLREPVKGTQYFLPLGETD